MKRLSWVALGLVTLIIAGVLVVRNTAFGNTVITNTAFGNTFISSAVFGNAATWNAEQKQVLQSLSLSSLPPLPADPSNRYADDPQAASLGQAFFFDPRFSSTAQIACSSCHRPDLGFSDGLALGRGVGRTKRKTMTVVGTAYSPFLFWDGRTDSQWAQATQPLEAPEEHNMNRTSIAKLIYQSYREPYEAVFGPLPSLADEERFPTRAGSAQDPQVKEAWASLSPEDQHAVNTVFTNLGKAIAAYERTLTPQATRFDSYVTAVLKGDKAGQAVLSPDEVAGLKLFIGKANCTDCHSGALLTNNGFHNTGVPAVAGLTPDLGRAAGASLVAENEFNCLSEYSDASPEDCAELRFLKVQGHELEGAFKVPTLRNIAKLAPYMHAGQFSSLSEVLQHYNDAPEARAGHSELTPLKLSEKQLQYLEAFLRSLDF